MGTSLNGLTPANTYQGLIKFGDNSALTSVLKALSDGNGNDTMLELSTTALQIGGSTGMYWDNTNKRLGVGTNNPTKELTIDANSTDGGFIIRSQTDATLFQVTKDGISGNTCELFQYSQGAINFAIRSATNASYFNNGTFTFGANTNLGAKLNVRGSGSTSATTSLLVQNSAGNTALQVKDDREFSTSGGNVSLRDGMLFIGSNFITTYGQSIGFFGATVASAIVEIRSTTKGFLPPRMTTTQKNAITSPDAGLMVYDTTLNQMSYYNGTSWINF